MANSNPDQPNECPSFEVLVEFDLGNLTEEQIETVANHLAQCDKCIDVLAKWHSRSTDNAFEKELRECMVDLSRDRVGHLPTVTAEPRAVSDTKSYDERISDLVRRPENLVGRRFGRYEILAIIGAGGMGVVYKARDSLVNRIIAIKMIKLGKSSHDARLVRFAEECKTLATIHHPNVVQFYHFDEYEGIPYFTMEFVEGKTLSSFVPKQDQKKIVNQEKSTTIEQNRIIPIAQSVSVLKTIALALQAIHQRKVIHRDLKPSNILIRSDGTPKIADFGLAKITELENRIDLTKTGNVMGTPSYMAPEQAIGDIHNIGPLSDVYALGAILYELLTGNAPFTGENEYDTIQKVVNDEPRRPSAVSADVPRMLEKICLKALAKKQADRHQSAQKLAEDLDDWLNNKHPRSLPSTFREIIQPTRRKAILVGLGAAASAAGVYAYRNDPDVIRRGIEADLREGKTVELIGEKGPPKWMKWVVGESKSTIVPGHEKLFTVQSKNDVSLIELVEDPQSNLYSIQIKVRHETAFDAIHSSVGVYVARQEIKLPEGNASLFATFEFNDLLSSQPKFDIEKGEILPGADAFHSSINCRIYKEPTSTDKIDIKIMKTNSPPIDPIGFSGGVWRTLSLMVNKNTVCCSWENGAFFQLDMLNLAQKFRNIKTVLPESSALRSFVPTFESRNGVGLFVSLGTASYKSMVIKIP